MRTKSVHNLFISLSASTLCGACLFLVSLWLGVCARAETHKWGGRKSTLHYSSPEIGTVENVSASFITSPDDGGSLLCVRALCFCALSPGWGGSHRKGHSNQCFGLCQCRCHKHRKSLSTQPRLQKPIEAISNELPIGVQWFYHRDTLDIYQE